MDNIKTVDEYIRNAPKEIQNKLQKLRATIKSVTPGAEERISYGMPYYGYFGRLVYFRYSKKYIGLYIPPPIVNLFKKQLKDYKTATATIQFPLDKKLPIALIKKLVRSRMVKNKKRKIRHLSTIV